MSNGEVVEQPINLYLWAQDTANAEIMPITNQKYVDQFKQLGYISGDWPIHDQFNAVWGNYSNWINYLNYQIGVKFVETIEEIQAQALSSYITGIDANKDVVNVPADTLGYSAGFVTLKKFGNGWGEGKQFQVSYPGAASLYIIKLGPDWYKIDDAPGIGIMANDAIVFGEKVSFYTFVMADENGDNIFLGADTNVTGANIVDDYVTKFSVTTDVYIRKIGSFITWNNGGPIEIMPVRQNGDIFYKDTSTLVALPNLATTANMTQDIADSLGLAPHNCDEYELNLILGHLNTSIDAITGSKYKKFNVKFSSRSTGAGLAQEGTLQFAIPDKNFYLENLSAEPIEQLRSDLQCVSYIDRREK